MKIIQRSIIWFTFSGILTVISFAAFAYNYVKFWNILNFWIDFTWWAMMEIKFEKEVQKDTLISTSNELLKSYYPLIQSIWNNSYIIRTKEISDDTHKKFLSDLKWKLWDLSEKQFTTIWPSVWETMKKNAFIAIFVAIIVIIIFIAFSFSNLPEELSSWKFGISAIVALVHDVIVTTWVFAILWIVKWVEIDPLFITAILTVIWFSVHDTIVVFDRIRENMQKKHSWDDFTKVWEVSLNQTFERSINTSVSTLIPITALYLLWSESISLFMLALVFWITFGTYSSIFIATPFLILISPKWKLHDIRKR